MDIDRLHQLVGATVGELDDLYAEIGVHAEERKLRYKKLLRDLSTSLNNSLDRANAEKVEKLDEAVQLEKKIEEINAAVTGRLSYNDRDIEDKGPCVNYPLNTYLQQLESRLQFLNASYQKALGRARKLAHAIYIYGSHLGPCAINVTLPSELLDETSFQVVDVSESYIHSLEEEYDRVYREYTQRRDMVQSIAGDIIKLCDELGIPCVDATILEHAADAPEKLGLCETHMAKLNTIKDELVKEKAQMEPRLRDLCNRIQTRWDLLAVDEARRQSFLATSPGCDKRTIETCENELARLGELMKEDLPRVIENARDRLLQLWDSLYLSEDEMCMSTHAFSNHYTEELLSAHEEEIDRLEALKIQRAPILTLLEKHMSLLLERENLSASAQDASRLMARGQKGERRDPGKLLREEKMRKRIARELPKVETELKRVLADYEVECGRPFMVRGENYLDKLAATSTSTETLPSRPKTPSANTNSQRPLTDKQTKSTASFMSYSGTPSRSNSVRSQLTKTPRPTQLSYRPASFRHTGGSGMGSISRRKNLLVASTPSNRGVGTGSPTKRRNHDLLSSCSGRPGREVSHVQGSSIIHSNMALPRTTPPTPPPPPEMKDLFTHSPEAINYESEDSSDQCSIVRPILPEDPYADRSFMSHARPGSGGSHDASQAPVGPQCAIRPNNRQASTTSSTAHTIVSSSENWETYDDASEPEPDASEDYYARLRAIPTMQFAHVPELNSLHRRSRPATGTSIREVGLSPRA